MIDNTPILKDINTVDIVYDISVVIPLLNEEDSLVELHSWIVNVLNDNQLTYEIIFIDDGSTDNSWHIIQDLKSKDENIKGIRFTRNYGKSPALHHGFRMAKGRVVITMDADLQDSPDEIPELYNMIVFQDYDLVSGWKKKRYDPLNKTIPTKLFNATVRTISGIKLHDFNCGLKAYKNEVVKNLEVYNDMHRFLPYMAKQEGFTKIGEKIVQHRPRKYGKTKFGVSRFVNGYLDLMVIWFTGKFGKKPMHFFGLLGSLMFLIGFIALCFIGAEKLIALSKGIPAPLVTSRPYFYLCLTGIILGVQLFLAGFIGELISRSSSRRNDYSIREII